jgi:ribulose-phosphate 3-epimerase
MPHNPTYQLAPSILAADIARLGEEVAAVRQAGADLVHFDVMDNHYVPNLSFGPMVCEALHRLPGSLPIDVHLMVKPVDAIVPEFAAAGANAITFHPEASEHIDRTLHLIRDLGCRAGLAFNPATPLDYLQYVIDKVDIILLMSVNPGFGGQDFLPSTLQKAREVRSLIQSGGHPIRLAVDGGVRLENIRPIAEAGVDTFVMGTAVFGTNDYHATLQAMRNALPSPPPWAAATPLPSGQ